MYYGKRNPFFQGKWERIEAGGSIIHEITVKPLRAGPQNITSAIFNYQTKPGSVYSILYS